MSEFHRAVKLVIDTVSFDKDSTVQVFEANIRYTCNSFQIVTEICFISLASSYRYKDGANRFTTAVELPLTFQ